MTRVMTGLLLLLVVGDASAQRVSSNVLPAPLGPFGIGRVTYHWTDSTRSAFVDSTETARRELTVDVWYPAARGVLGPAAEYLPELPTLRRAMPDSVLRRRFAPAYEAMAAGALETHAVERARVACAPRRCPLLVFSHGGGLDRSYYAAQLEDLASHGYIVAAIAHTYDTHVVVFPDGRVVRARSAPRDTRAADPSLPRWRQQLAAEFRSQAYVRRVIEVEAADVRFVVSRMERLTDGSAAQSLFAGTIDPSRIGAFGHSIGGETAARACQLDRRITACLNQDGVMNNLPFGDAAPGEAMTQPFLYIGRRADFTRPRLSDSTLAEMQLTRVEADSIVRAGTAAQTTRLAELPAGAYRVVLEDPAASHMSFSDLPMIEAARDTLAYANARRVLVDIERVTRGFFDQVLLGRRAPILSALSGGSATRFRVDRFPPTRGRRPH